MPKEKELSEFLFEIPKYITTLTQLRFILNQVKKEKELALEMLEFSRNLQKNIEEFLSILDSFERKLCLQIAKCKEEYSEKLEKYIEKKKGVSNARKK